jgi:hypothetical protein
MAEGEPQFSEEERAEADLSRRSEDEGQAEAEKFNRMVDEGLIGTEYASTLPKEQSPELTKEIIKNAEEHIRDVNAYGELAHGSILNQEEFVDIIENGLKTLADKHGGVENIPSVYRFTSFFPDMVSFAMNGFAPFANSELKWNAATSFGVTEPQYEFEKEQIKSGMQFGSKHMGITFIANPRYITQALEHEEKDLSDRGQKPVIFVDASSFNQFIHMDPQEIENDESPFFKRLTDYCKSVGWVSAYKHGKGSVGAFLHYNTEPSYEAFPGEVIVSNKYTKLVKEPMVDGVVIDPRHSRQTIQWMNSYIPDHPERAIPVYDIYGNLLWPRKMTNEQVKQFVAEREAKKAEEENESQ